jgi:perosamine synthetase
MAAHGTPRRRLSDELPYGRHWIDEHDVAAVDEVLRGDWLTQGPCVARFETALARTTGARHAVAVASGTAGLHLACLAAGVRPGDTGVTSAITFLASANCIAYCGGTPAFADVDAASMTLDPERLEAVCRARPPRVIIPVDFAGQPADLPEIQAIARRHGALVIEDAAHALGARYEHGGVERAAAGCAHADLAVLSFHPVKHVTTAEGGAVLTNDAALCERLRELRSHGVVRDPERLTREDGPWYHEQQALGFNFRLSDLQCALGLSQLLRLEAFVERRRALVARYREALAGLAEHLELLLERPGRRSSYHLLVARLRGGAPRRRAVFEFLRARGIRCQVHYYPVPLQPYYRSLLGTREGDFPRAEAYYAGCLSLPLFPRMADADVDRVADALRAAFSERA